jgi:UDP-2,3-diacylglucosamine hydrolase
VIADLHLDGNRRAATRLLLDFLQGPARKARALYVLGDLFEAWIGDDAPLAPAQEVADGLRALAATGVGVFFLVGNRDFLLGEAYCRQAGMTLLQEPVHLEQAGHSLVLMHGDALCTDDEDYQKFRARVRNPSWQQRMLARPAWQRRQLARLARFISRRRNRGKPEAIMDVNAQTVASILRDLATRNLVHGHTHRPAIHRLDLDQGRALRAVLGDWHEDHGSAIRIRDGVLSLLDLTRDEQGQLLVSSRDQERLG